jgi:hypothetical protein
VIFVSNRIILLLICLTLTISKCLCEEETLSSCKKKYLNAKRLLDDDIDFKTETDSQMGPECDNIVSNFQALFYSGFLKKVLEKNEEELNVIIDCIVEEMKQANLADMIMKKQVYSQFQSDKAQDLSKKLDREIDWKSLESFLTCNSGKAFDNIFTISVESPYSLLEKYCYRKHLLDNNFITSAEAEVELNLGAFDVGQIYCTDTIDKFLASLEGLEDEQIDKFEEAFKNPSEAKRQCITSAVHEGQFNLIIMRATFFRLIGVSGQRRADERAKFVSMTQKVNLNINKCSEI